MTGDMDQVVFANKCNAWVQNPVLRKKDRKRERQREREGEREREKSKYY
jgi:hypothetical protein